jgi:hypothetical protein
MGCEIPTTLQRELLLLWEVISRDKPLPSLPNIIVNTLKAFLWETSSKSGIVRSQFYRDINKQLLDGYNNCEIHYWNSLGEKEQTSYLLTHWEEHKIVEMMIWRKNNKLLFLSWNNILAERMVKRHLLIAITRSLMCYCTNWNPAVQLPLSKRRRGLWSGFESEIKNEIILGNIIDSRWGSTSKRKQGRIVRQWQLWSTERQNCCLSITGKTTAKLLIGEVHEVLSFWSG